MAGGPALAFLRARAGVWHGSGVSHDGEPFLGTLQVRGALAGRGVSVGFEARTEDKQLLHAEELLCVEGDGPLEPGRAVYVPSEGMPLVLELRAPDGPDAIEIRSPDLESPGAFRICERIASDPDGDLAIVWSWGLPGELFAERSRATLTRGGA
jgi:hypothetical protein